jgi:hypothetical protein
MVGTKRRPGLRRGRRGDNPGEPRAKINNQPVIQVGFCAASGQLDLKGNSLKWVLVSARQLALLVELGGW